MLLIILIVKCIAIKYEDAILFHWKGNLSSNSITMKVFPHQNVITEFRIISWDNENYNNYQQYFMKIVKNEYILHY